MVIQVKIKSRDFSSARQHSYFGVTHCENSEFQIRCIFEMKHATEMKGGGTPHMKWEGILVVLLRRVNFGFWSHLEGWSGQNAIMFSREGLV